MQTKTYTSLESTLHLSIYDKTAAKKRWALISLQNLFFGRRNNLSLCILFAMFAMLRSQKSLRKDPITGHSFIKYNG